MILIFLILVGILLFSLSAGNYMYLTSFKRSAFEKKSFIKNEPHVKDQKIMESITSAKQRWLEKRVERNIEEIYIKGFSRKGWRNKITVRKAPLLCGELWEPNTQIKKNLVIIVHGFSDSSNGMGYLAEEYNAKNFIVLVVNLRAHGKSSGKYPGLGYLDAKDMLKWILYVKNRYGEKIHIVLHGVSMGGSTVIQTLFSNELWKDNNCLIDEAVSDCSFGYFKDQIKTKIMNIFGKSKFQRAIGNFIYAGFSWACFFHAGFFIGESSPIKKIEKLKIANNKRGKTFLVIFQGLKDSLVNPENANMIYRAAEKKNITNNIVIKIDGAPHIGSYFYEPKKYMNTVIENLI